SFYFEKMNSENRPVCLLCTECISVCKEYNLRRHFKTTHANFDTTFPLGSDARRHKICGLTSCYEQRRRTLFRACTEQERAMSASLRVAWILGKKKREFTDAETVKECMLASIEEVTDEKTQNSLIDSIKKIPLSDTSTIRRKETLALDICETLLDKLRKAELMSLAVDESTDNSNLAQLCLYVRFFDGEFFREDQLGLIHLVGQATGEVLFNTIVTFFGENQLDLERINMLVGGCETMDCVIAIINFIRCTSSLQLNAFKRKLTLFSADLCPGKILHFPTLRKSDLQITDVMTRFIDALKNTFATRFDHFSIPTEVMRFVNDPFCGGEFSSKAKELVMSLNEASLQLKLIDIRSSEDLQQSFQLAGSEKFWTHEVSHEKFSHSRSLVLFILTMFGSTYTCKSLFSHMKAIKTNNRESLSAQHLHHCMRIALTTYTPDFTALAKSKKFSFVCT
uniref:HAT C-terminal dimerisation domain-containing protein n=1 Tax=Esox lucius TaxID=8010 RepID=A0AAY5KR19_ESOLU